MTSLSRPPATGVDDDANGMSLTAAAELLDVHYMTAYRYVRTGRMHATKRSGVWWVTTSDVEVVLAEGTGPRHLGRTGQTSKSSSSGDSRSRNLRMEPFLGRLLVGDQSGCWKIVTDALASGATPAEVQKELIHPALVTIGEQWSIGELSVASEHRATATAQRLVGQMGPLFRHRGRRRGTAVVGVAAGDSHALPSALFADLLADRRIDSIDLGANTPTESFFEVASDLDDLVGIGLCVLLDEAVPTAIETLRELRDALPDVTLIAGGPAIVRAAPEALADLVDHVTLSAEAACDAFEAAIATRRN